MFLFRDFFLLLKTIEIMGGTILRKKYFTASGNHFRFLSQKKQFFLIVETYFSMSASFFIFYLVKTIYFTCEFFPTSRNRHWYEWKPFFKNRTYSCWWTLIFYLLETIFFHFLRYFSRSSSSRIVETNFSVQKKMYWYLLRTFFPATGNHYLDCKEAY